MAKKKVTLVHVLPLEFFPPATNLLNFLSKDEQVAVSCFSTHNHKSRPIYKNASVTIKRTHYPAYVAGRIKSLFALLTMIGSALWFLLRKKPDAVVYIEPHSALPVYLYARFFNRKAKIFIHHHEYYTKEEYKAPSMKMVDLGHQKEVSYLYKRATWISQTNAQRLDFFAKDYAFVTSGQLHIMPNYPPSSWKKAKVKQVQNDKLKLVYLGAISFENTYVRELVHFVNANNTQYSLDIYTFNVHKDVDQFLLENRSESIHYHNNGVQYDDIPKTLTQFDIGVILYKGHNLNYTYNAPNKLFEYLACDLGVWVPLEMEGCKPYLSDKVMLLDFNKLTYPLPVSDKLPPLENTFYCEEVYQNLLDCIHEQH